MQDANIYDSYMHKVGYIENDVWYDDCDHIKGYIIGDAVTDSRQYGMILCRIHSDGTITEGTSNKIVCRVHEDGAITEGTSNRIMGKIEYSRGNSSNVNDYTDSYSGGYRRNAENEKLPPGCAVFILVVWLIISIIISANTEFSFWEVFIGFPIAVPVICWLMYVIVKLFG